ncbi:MAG: alanine racemase [Gammaproteobacteria bacterium]|nr:alanine racemase [Gammaproteobacteria bacterium]
MRGAARAVIDTHALRHNFARARAAAPRSRIMAVVKANAYGHGIVPVARALAVADALAVARIEEGMRVRAAGIENPIVLLEGVFNAEQLALAAQQGFEIVVHSTGQLELLKLQRTAQPLKVWLKVDTGMHRLGVDPDDFVACLAALRSCPAVAQPVRLMTHLANADDASDPTSEAQIGLFERLTNGIPGERSIANSAGILAWPASHADWVRPGLMLYGASPLRDASAAGHGLEPAMTLATELIAIKTARAGARVGYGGIWQARRDTLLGVAAVGYGDGYPRAIQNGTPVLVNGRKAPMVGRVSMDMITIDLTDSPDARVGDPVVLWGKGLPVDEIAPRADTTAYELLCNVSQRVELEVI